MELFIIQGSCYQYGMQSGDGVYQQIYEGNIFDN